MMRPSTIIDGDGHICEPEIVWTEYTAAKFRDDVLQIRTANGKSDIYIENRPLPFGAGAGPAEACILRGALATLRNPGRSKMGRQRDSSFGSLTWWAIHFWSGDAVRRWRKKTLD